CSSFNFLICSTTLFRLASQAPITETTIAEIAPRIDIKIAVLIIIYCLLKGYVFHTIPEYFPKRFPLLLTRVLYDQNECSRRLLSPHKACICYRPSLIPGPLVFRLEIALSCV